MQKKRCTALFGWMGDASAFIRPVKIFPSVEAILKLDAAGHVAYKRSPSLQMISPVSLGRERWLAFTCCTLMAITLFAAPPNKPQMRLLRFDPSFRHSRMPGTGAILTDL